MHCFGVVSENPKKDSRQEYFRQSLREFPQYLRSVGVQDLSQGAQGSQHEHAYFELLTLCHPEKNTATKYRLFLNRLKISCEVDFRKQTAQEAEQKHRESQEEREDTASAEEEGRLKEQEKRLEEKGEKSSQQLNQEEYRNLEA